MHLHIGGLGSQLVVIEGDFGRRSAVVIQGDGVGAFAGQFIIGLQIPGFGNDRFAGLVDGLFGVGSDGRISSSVHIVHLHVGGHDHGGAGVLRQGSHGGHIQAQHNARIPILGESGDFNWLGGGQVIPGFGHVFQQGAVGQAEGSVDAGHVLNVQGSAPGLHSIGQLQPVSHFIPLIGDGGGIGGLGFTPVIHPLDGYLIGIHILCIAGHGKKARQQCQQEQENGCFFMCTGHGFGLLYEP